MLSKIKSYMRDIKFEDDFGYIKNNINYIDMKCIKDDKYRNNKT